MYGAPKYGVLEIDLKNGNAKFYDCNERAPFERAINESKIEDFKYHDLRHSCASYLAMSGVPIRTIAEILGHSNTSVTVRYSHLNKEHLKKSLDELSKVLAS